MKKLYSVAAATIAGSFLLTGVAFAGFGVDVFNTSEEVAAHSPCDLGPAFSFEFGPGTIFTEGDEIIVDLPYDPNGPRVTLCKDMDYVIAPGGKVLKIDALVAANMWNAPGVFPAKTDAVPFGYTGPTALAAGDFGAGAGTDGFAFHVTGAKGGDRIKVEVLSNTSGAKLKGKSADPADGFQLDLFKREGSGVSGETYLVAAHAVLLAQDATNKKLYGGDTAGGVADNFVSADDNTLCLNVSEWTRTTVDASIKSNPNNVFTFAPTNPEIAHLRDGAIAFQNCTKSVVGPVDITPVTQTTAVCTIENGVFKGGTGASAVVPSGYADTHNNPILIVSQNELRAEKYALKLTILTAPEGGTPQPGNGGVYFADDAGIDIYTYASKSAACADKNLTVGTKKTLNTSIQWTDAGGGTTTSSAKLPGSCDDLDDSTKGRYITMYAEMNTKLAAGQKAFLVNIPKLIYDYRDVNPGDIVDVRVELHRAPCGLVVKEDKPVVRSFQDPTGAVATLTFPYFAKPDPFWNGIALVNLASAEVEVDLTLTEVDGDVGEGKVTIPAGEMYANTLTGMIQQGVLELTSGDGELGDTNAYMKAVGPSIDGFTIMSNGSGVSMGYLPRK